MEIAYTKVTPVKVSAETRIGGVVFQQLSTHDR